MATIDSDSYTVLGYCAVSAGLSGRGKLIALWPAIGSHDLREGESSTDDSLWIEYVWDASIDCTVPAD